MSDPAKYADQICQSFLEHLLSMRLMRGWTVNELGKAAGVSGQVIQSIEKGRTKISLQMLGRITVAFDIKLTEFAALLEQSAAHQSTRSGIVEKRKMN